MEQKFPWMGSRSSAVNAVAYFQFVVIAGAVRSIVLYFHVVYDTNRYSLPWTLVGLAVTLKINATHIKIFYNESSVTTHVRSYQKNKVFTLDAQCPSGESA